MIRINFKFTSIKASFLSYFENSFLSTYFADKQVNDTNVI